MILELLLAVEPIYILDQCANKQTFVKKTYNLHLIYISEKLVYLWDLNYNTRELIYNSSYS